MSIDCSICFMPTSPQDRYVCQETGRGQNRGMPHMPFHLTCTQSWAASKGAPNTKVMCIQTGCKTDISYLVPKPQSGYFARAIDFLEKYPSTTILASGLTAWGVGYAYGPVEQLKACAILGGTWCVSSFLGGICNHPAQVLGVPAGIAAVFVGVTAKASGTGVLGSLIASTVPFALTAMAVAPAELIAESEKAAFVATSVILGLSLIL